MLTNFTVASAPLRPANPDLGPVNKLSDELGPVPRLYMELDQDKLEFYRQDLEEALDKLSNDKLQKLADMGECLQMDAISRKVCLILRFYSSSVFHLTLGQELPFSSRRPSAVNKYAYARSFLASLRQVK
jgi:hypothetical protein